MSSFDRLEGRYAAHVVETAPIAILIQDLRGVWRACEALRRAGVQDLGAHLDADPAAQSGLLNTIEAVSANRQARFLLGQDAIDDLTGTLRQVLRHPDNASLGRDSLLALWSGAESFEGEVSVVTDRGVPLRAALTLELPRTLEQARHAAIYLIDRTDAFRREERLRLTFEKASHGMALLDLSGRWRQANQALCAMLGYSAQELMALSVRDVTHPDDWSYDEDWLQGLSTTPETEFAREKRYLRKDGQVVFAHVSGALLPAVQGDAPLIMAHIQDVSLRHRAEQQLRTSEARFRHAFDLAAHGMAVAAPDGRIQHANRQFCRALGRDEKELVDVKVEHLGDSAATRAEERYRREHLLSDPATSSYVLEKRLSHADGSSVWLKVSASLVRDQAGRAQSLLYQAYDVSGERIAQTRALTAESQLLGAVETVADDVLLFDSEDRLVLVNSHLLNTEPDLADVLVPETPFKVIIHRIADLALIDPVGDRSLAEWRHWRLERFRQADAEPFEVRTRDGRWMLVRQGRAADGSTLILRSNITELKRREVALITAKAEADRANRAKSEFLANMSHELHTPLNAINGFSEVMLKELHGPLGAPPYREYVRNIFDAGQHLLEIISDILDLSRIEAGDLTLHEAQAHPYDLVSRTLRVMLPTAQEKSLEVRNHIPPDGPTLVCDAARLRQVLSNLLTNAIKFTDPGGSILLIGRVGRSGQYILSVSDTGRGMTEQEIAKALTNFGQIEGVFTRNTGGTGLGLPLTRALVEAHGGTLDIMSQAGVGTTVSVRLPAHRVVGSGHGPIAVESPPT